MVDNPRENMFAIRDHIEESTTIRATLTANAICEPDRSMFPLVPLFGLYGTRLDLFRLNGVKLADHLDEDNFKRSLWNVVRNIVFESLELCRAMSCASPLTDISYM